MHQRFVWLSTVAGLALLALISCGKTATVGEVETGLEPPVSSSAEETLYTIADGCCGLDDSEAAALLGIPVDDLEKSTLGEMFGNACSIKSSSEPFTKAILFTLYREESVAVAKAELERMKGDFALTVPAEPINDLGDEAVWFGSKDPVMLKRLLARKGNVWIDVGSAVGGMEGSVMVAQVVFQKLD